MTQALKARHDHAVRQLQLGNTNSATWTREKKRQFANDPINLIAVGDNINQSKSDQAPNEWMPPKKEYWC